MLLKLIRNELKRVYLIVLIVLGSLLVSSIIYCLLGLLGLEIVRIFFMMFYYEHIVAAQVLLIIIIIMSLRKNLFGKEGYLQLTIPVSTKQLILSKIIANSIWVALDYIILIISLFLMANYVNISSFFNILSFTKIIQVLSILLEVLIYFLFSFSFIFMIISFTKSGTLKTKRVLVAIIGGYILFTLYFVLISAVRIIPFNISLSKTGFILEYIKYSTEISIGFTNLNTILITMILTVGNLFLTKFFIDKKLEL